MKVAGIALLILMTGCASAEQRMESKENYREAQVRAIEVQANAGVNRQQVKALERQAMWQALAEVVKANPEAASNVAIVAAVAAARTNADGESETTMMSIKTEQSDAQAWAKILAAPVLQTITTVGVQALNADLQKEISRNQTEAIIAETEQDGKIYDMIGVIAQSRGEGGTTYNVSDNGAVNTGYQDNDEYGDSAIENDFDPEQPMDDVPPPDPDEISDEVTTPFNGGVPTTPDNKGPGTSIFYIEGEGWFRYNEHGELYSLNPGSEDIAYDQERYNEKISGRLSDWSDYSEYAGGTSESHLNWLRSAVGGDYYWSAGNRMQELAYDESFWRKEMIGRSDSSYSTNAAVVGRYKELRDRGYTHDQIYNYIFSDADLSP